MTTAREGSTPTALDLLFGRGADAAETLADEILSPGGDQNFGRALAHLSETTRKAAAQEAATTMTALLKVDLIGVLVRGWREHGDIVSAARRTLAAPGSTELVSMSAHEVTLDQRPSVSVLVDGQQVATLQLGLSIVFDVNALLLVISGGRLVAVRSGRCEITATLAVQGTELVVRHAHLELPGVIPIRRGIRLLPVAEYPAGEYPPGEYTSSGHQASELRVRRDDPSVPWGVTMRCSLSALLARRHVLAGFLASHGVTAVQADLNEEFVLHLLSEEVLSPLAAAACKTPKPSSATPWPCSAAPTAATTTTPPPPCTTWPPCTTRGPPGPGRRRLHPSLGHQATAARSSHPELAATLANLAAAHAALGHRDTAASLYYDVRRVLTGQVRPDHPLLQVATRRVAGHSQQGLVQG